MLKVAAVIFVVLPLAAVAMNCTSAPDGNYEIGCRVYTTCSGGQATVTACKNDTIYNSATGRCDNPENVKPPCGQMKDCTNKADGHYADLDNGCHSFYTCVGGDFAGHNFCPDNLVFNESNKLCDWSDNVQPPCGTHGTNPSP